MPAVVASGALEIRGRKVREDEQGRVSLNDIHELAGSPKGKEPKRWGQLPSAKELLETLAKKKGGKSVHKAESDYKSVYYTKLGRGGGTFADPIIALAYAKYLSPELHIEVNKVFHRHKISVAENFRREKPDMEASLGAPTPHRARGDLVRPASFALRGSPSLVHSAGHSRHRSRATFVRTAEQIAED